MKFSIKQEIRVREMSLYCILKLIHNKSEGETFVEIGSTCQ